MEATLRVSSVTVSNLDQRKKESTHQYSSVPTIYCCHPVICCALYLALFFFFNNSSKKLLFWFCVNTESLGKAKSKQWMKCSNVVSETPTCSISLFLQYMGKVILKCFLLFFFLPRCFPWGIYSVHLRDSIWEKPFIIYLFEKVIQSSIIWSESKLVQSKREWRAGKY